MSKKKFPSIYCYHQNQNYRLLFFEPILVQYSLVSFSNFSSKVLRNLEGWEKEQVYMLLMRRLHPLPPLKGKGMLSVLGVNMVIEKGSRGKRVNRPN